MLDAITLIVPPVAPGVTDITFEVLVPVHPDGNDHIYDLAPTTGGTEYCCVAAEQTTALPTIALGCVGVISNFTLKVSVFVFPQGVTANAEILPADDPAIVVIEFVELEPTQPEGKDQTYDVAFATTGAVNTRV
jgi:hypothetical protein